MTTWVEDITQALKNLGGQATLNQIYDEVKRIRIDPLSDNWHASIRERIEAYSSDSHNFKGKDYFRKVEKGIWALRDQVEKEGSLHVSPAYQSQAPHNLSSSKGKGEFMATWVEDITQALKNLGGQATLNQIYEEVRRTRHVPLPKMWQHIIQDTIYQNSSDTQKFQGNDLFRKVDKGVWALRNHIQIEPNIQATSGNTEPIFRNNLPSDSFEAFSKENKMDNYELIQDTGLFVGQKLFEFSLTESFESISNLLQTIKEYREYANPVEADWFEYIHQIFYIFGFNTTKVAPRLITLHEMGVNNTPKALVCIVGPKEDFNQIIIGLTWESYLFYAAKFHQVEWVILTNGLQFKVLNYGDNADNQKYFKCELDEIIKSGKTDSFFTLYKIFSVINHKKDEKSVDQGGGVSKIKIKGKRVITERNLILKEFWGQLLSRSKSKTKLFGRKSPGIGHWLGIGAGKSGISYNYIITIDGTRIELYIDNGDGNWNKSVFDLFYDHKQEIEDVIGDSILWKRLDDRRASVIQYSLGHFGIKDKDKWPELQEQMIEAMIRFEKAFRPFINKIT